MNEQSIVPPLPTEKELLDNSDFIQLLPMTKKNINNLAPLNSALNVIGGNNWRDDGPMTAAHQNAFQQADSLRKASTRHSWTRATVMTVGRSAIGSGFTITRHPVYGKVTVESKIENPTDIPELQPVYDFFYGQGGDDITHIQDLYPNSSKILYTIVSLVLYGQVAWEIKRDKQGNAVSFDVLPGYVFPNVDDTGKFLKPAYYYRPWNSPRTYEFKKAKDIFYLTWPGTDMSIFGVSEYAAAAESSIPSDLYASAVYRSHFENINAPFNGFWIVDPTTTDEDFKKFVSMVFNRYTGVRNFGRNPIIVRGNAEFKEMRSRSNDDAPYLEGRRYNQEEISAISGVSSSKLGIGSSVSRTNFREQRRDFWETTLRPIYAIIEEAIYRQVFVRLFNLREWHLTFNRPDLTTALEEATILTRYIQNGVMNPNEARFAINLPPRDDEFGFKFYDPLAAKVQPGLAENQGNTNSSGQDRASEGESDRSQDMKRPPTVDRPQSEDDGENKSIWIDDNHRTMALAELRTWKKFAMKALDNKRPYRTFESQWFPKEFCDGIEQFIQDNVENKETVRHFFDEIINMLI